MCTVTYIPRKDKSYILTSNRDESFERGSVTIFPQQLERNGKTVLSPIDEKANGTWLLTTEDRITLCILNGAFQKHKHQPPYRYSRGLIPFKYLEYSSTDEFIDFIDLKGVEPFTLVICEKGIALSTLVWDGLKKHISKLDPNEPCIWSSSTLYDSNTKEYKEQLFNDYLSKIENESINTLDFHTIGIDNPIEPCIFIKREKVQTVSISVVTVDENHSVLFHQDYLKNKNNKLHLQLSLA